MKDIKTIRMLQWMRAVNRIPAQNMMQAYPHVKSSPENAIPVIAWNLTTPARLILRSGTYLTRTLDVLSKDTSLLKKPIVQGALQVMLNETSRLLTSSSSTEESKKLFYPHSVNEHLIPFMEHYFRYNPLSLSMRSRLSNPKESYIRFYEGAPYFSHYFGPYYHTEVVDHTLDTKVIKFDDCMSDYVVFHRFEILNDLVRKSFIKYPPDLAHFNEQLRIIEIMFGKTALSAEESQKLFRGALNLALYGCEDYEKVEETIARLQTDRKVVSQYLKLISADIRRHGEQFGFSVRQSFVPDPKYFAIHTSFNAAR